MRERFGLQLLDGKPGLRRSSCVRAAGVRACMREVPPFTVRGQAAAGGEGSPRTRITWGPLPKERSRGGAWILGSGMSSLCCFDPGLEPSRGHGSGRRTTSSPGPALPFILCGHAEFLLCLGASPEVWELSQVAPGAGAQLRRLGHCHRGRSTETGQGLGPRAGFKHLGGTLSLHLGRPGVGAGGGQPG